MADIMESIMENIQMPEKNRFRIHKIFYKESIKYDISIKI